VYSFDQSLALYDVAADSVAIVEQSGSGPDGLRPRFRTPGLVSFVVRRAPPGDENTYGPDSLYELDVERNTVTEILRLPDSLWGYDWSPDGTLLAYELFAATDEILPLSLCLYDSRDGSTALLRSLAIPVGTGTGQREERSVAWSASGNQILAVDTAEAPSIYVVNRDGADVIAPRRGSFARWTSDDDVLLQEEPERFDQKGAWITVSTTTGRTSPFGMPAGTFRPALSPGGNLFAYDNGGPDTSSVFVFDPAGDRSRRLAHGYGAPVWLSSDLIAATAAGPCPPQTECSDWWVPLGRAIGIDASTGASRPLRLPTTLQEAPRYGVIDVSLATPS
jgi:hypothetical protein